MGVAKWWSEPLDPAKHRDHSPSGGPVSPEPTDPLIPRTANFVRVCGFTFEFVSIDQLIEALRYYEQGVRPSSRRPVFAPEKGHWESWSERLPMYLLEAPNRLRVVKALSSALSAFGAGKV